MIDNSITYKSIIMHIGSVKSRKSGEKTSRIVWL